MSYATIERREAAFTKRIEPAYLKKDGKYVNLRECVDVAILSTLKSDLEARVDGVVLPWLARPFGLVFGYGIYSKNDAKSLREISKKEGWADPIPGMPYDVSWIKARLDYIVKDNP